MRGTTRSSQFQVNPRLISIHVPREGDDKIPDMIQVNISISIHVPREGDDRMALGVYTALGGRFQSTSPVRGTTDVSLNRTRFIYISIHVPREGDDRLLQRQLLAPGDFNPRPP